MLEQLRFYLSHSFNDLRVNKRLTFFALLSVAAGVAAIVSLQTLALMISNTLDVNLQANNRGDVSIQLNIVEPDAAVDAAVAEGIINLKEVNVFGQSVPEYKLTPHSIEVIEDWIAESDYAGQVDVTYRLTTTGELGVFTGMGTGVSVTDVESGNQASQLSPIIVDPNAYPYYSDIMTTDGQTLADVLQQPTDIVVGDALATQLELQVGDTVRLNGSSATFTVRGIVKADEEIKNIGTDFFTGIFGFYYLNFEAMELFENVTPDVLYVYFQMDDPTQVLAFNDALLTEFPYLSTTTIEDMREDNEQLTEQIDTFVAVMGLISLLLGSIGIINTMQVVVRRRMLEIAVLKTLGLQSDQITYLFLTEAFLVGIFGSLFGIVLGWVATYALRGVVGNIFSSDIPFLIAPLPAINGFAVGVVVATVFGFLPTLTAGQVRPGIVLRPSQSVIPRAGIVRSLLALALIIIVVSVIVNGIVNNVLWSVVGVIGAFIAAGVIYLLLVAIIWVIGRFVPTFGFIDLKVSLRQMLATKSRGASTLLALVVGVFSLSTITLFAQSISNILESALESTGGNVIVSAQSYSQLPELEEVITSVEGVNSHTVILAYNTELVSYTDSETGETYDVEGLRQQLREANVDFPPAAFFEGTAEERDEIQQEIFDSLLINAPIESRSQLGESDATFVSGRELTEADAGQPVLVLQENELLNAIGLSAGDSVTYNIVNEGMFGTTSEEVTFEIVGVRPEVISVSFGSPYYAPAGAFPEDVPPSSVTVMVDINEEQIPALRRALAEVPGSFVVETSTLTRLISSLLGTFTAFPTMVAALGLIVGGVVIANSVALATMERRHEIAVMKSVGLQRERVLGMLLLENGILGFIGGLMGVGYGLIALTVFSLTLQTPLSSIPFGLAFLLMLLCVAVALIAAITSAWDASGEKPLTVLRYE